MMVEEVKKQMKKKKNLLVIFAFIALVVFGVIGMSLRGNRSIQGAAVLETKLSLADAEKDIYPMFICPCCGNTIDNCECGTATKMKNYINSLVDEGISKKEITLKAVETFGITSIIESERAGVEAELMKRNPDLFPSEKLEFSQALGQKAPDFTLQSIDGTTVKLSDYAGKNVILFFNEGSMCYPACWDQIAALGNDARLNTNNIVAFSILVDQKSEWEKIVSQVPQLSKAKILFDTTRAISSAYDVLSLKSSMHPGSYPGHTYFIIDKEGIVRFVFDDPNMAIWNDKLVDEMGKLV